MKLHDLLSRIDTTKENEIENYEYVTEIEQLFEALLSYSMYSYDIGALVVNDNDRRLKCYWIKTWICTDTRVGWKAHYLDGELVCTSYQSGRKYDKQFSYISHETRLKLIKYLYELYLLTVDKDSDEIINMDEEVPDNYLLPGELVSYHFHKCAIYERTNERVSLLSVAPRCGPYYNQNVVIRFPNGEQKNVDCGDLLFEYHMVKE